MVREKKKESRKEIKLTVRSLNVLFNYKTFLTSKVDSLY